VLRETATRIPVNSDEAPRVAIAGFVGEFRDRSIGLSKTFNPVV
jgi:hypothetical protein